MKLFNSKNTTNKRWTGLTMLFIGIIATGITSCNKDDDPSGDDSGEEVETAYVRALDSYTPSGTINYFEVIQDLSAEVDLSKAVELGQNTRIYSLGAHPFTINRNAKTITRWKVDKKTLELSVDAILSYASTGSNSNNIAFVSETSAFITDLVEGIIIEFNPSIMEITKIHNVTQLEVPTNINASYNGYSNNGKLIFPIRWQATTCCDYSEPLYATIAVFDPATESLVYDVDERNISINRILYTDENNDAFLLPNYQNAWFNHFFNANQKGFSVLKLNDNGNIDDSYEVNLEEGLPNITIYKSSSFVYQDNAVFTYSEDEITGSFDDRFANYNAMESKAVSYNLNTHEVKPFTAFDTYLFVNRKAIIDGKGHFAAYTATSDSYNTDLLVQNGLENFTVIATIQGGDFPYVEKLW